MISHKNKFDVYPTIDEMQNSFMLYDKKQGFNGYGELEIIKADFEKMEYFFTVQEISLMMCISEDALQFRECPFNTLDHKVYGNIMDMRIDSKMHYDNGDNNNLDIV
jgi:hypothetical protein